jgi:hypothetical protein
MTTANVTRRRWRFLINGGRGGVRCSSVHAWPIWRQEATGLSGFRDGWLASINGRPALNQPGQGVRVGGAWEASAFLQLSLRFVVDIPCS